MKPRLIALKVVPGKERQVLSLKSKETVLGREKGCKIRIPSTAVSRQHCRFIVLNDMLTVEDLGSSNGTFVNDVRIKELSYLKPGDVLRIGPFRFLVHYHLTEEAVKHLLGVLAAAAQKSGAAEEDESIDVELLDEPGTSPSPALKP